MLPVPRPLTALAALLIAAALVAIPALPASAHARLVGSTPTEGEVVDAMPTTITLEFNELVEADFGQLQVSGSDGERLDQTPPSAEGSTVTSEIAAPTSAGTHTVAFRIISADGHPVEGQFTFEVSDAAVAAAADADAEPAEGDADPAADSTADEAANAPQPDAIPADDTTGDPGVADGTDEADQTDGAGDLDDAEALAADGDDGALILPIAVVLLVALAVGGALFARRRGADTGSPPAT